VRFLVGSKIKERHFYRLVVSLFAKWNFLLCFFGKITVQELRFLCRFNIKQQILWLKNGKSPVKSSDLASLEAEIYLGR